MRGLWDRTGILDIVRIVLIELNKTVINWSFAGSVIAVVGVMLCIPLYKEDGTTVNSLYIFFLGNTKQILNESCLDPQLIIRGVRAGYFVMFAPMIVSASVLPILCDRDYGGIRYLIIRGGIRNLVAGQFIASILVGGIVLVLGYTAFSVIVIVNAPQLIGPMINDVMLYNSGIFLYGMISAMWTCLVSVMVRNRYLVAGIPYIFMWLVERRISRLEYANTGAKIFGAGYILSIFEDEIDKLMMIGTYMGISVLVVIVMYEFKRRRVDCGS